MTILIDFNHKSRPFAVLPMSDKRLKKEPGGQNTKFAFDPKDETFLFFFGCTFRAKSRPLCPLDEAAPFSDVAPQPLSHYCPILYPGTLSAIQPTFSDGFNQFLVQATCRQFYLEKVSQLVVMLRITGNTKTTL